MRHKKKVLFYNGSLRMGGIERVMIDVLQGLDKGKMDILLVIEDGIKELNIFEKSVPKEIEIVYLKPEYIIKKTDFYKKNRKRSFISKIIYGFMYGLMMKYEEMIKRKKLKLISNNEFDVIIDYDMGLSKYIDYFNSKKKIAWIHSSIPNWYKRKDRIKRLGNRLKKYTNIVAICDEMKEQTVSLFPFLKDKIVRIYNPISFSRIKGLANDDNYERLNEEKYILSIMRLTEDSKDFDTLIKAWQELLKKHININLIILGEGPDRTLIENKIELSGLKDKIILKGNVENPYVWIKNSEMVVHSSKYEGLPTVLIEALVLNKYVISSACPTGPKEIICNPNIGALYDVGDYKKLADLIENNLYKYCNKEDYSRSIAKFEKNNVLAQYEKIILE